MKYRLPLGMSWIALMVLRYYKYINYMGQGLAWDTEQRMVAWFGILAILGFGKRYLNFNNKFTKYFSSAAFPIYYFHQTVLVTVAFAVVKLTNIISLQFALIAIISFVITLLCYEVFRRFSVTRFMFGIKYIESKKSV